MFTQYGPKGPQNIMEQHKTTTNLLKSVPHVRRVSLHMQTITALICQRLSWDEAKYNEFQMEAGLEFLAVALSPLKGTQSCDEKLLTHSRLFWGWWRNEWYKRDLAIYRWSSLSKEDYEYLHTNDVTGCEDTRIRFWSHVQDFIKAGEKALKAEVTA